MLDFDEGKRLVVVALNAALPVAKLDEMEIFEDGHFAHVELDAKGIVIAPDKEEEFAVWIEPVVKDVEVETLAGKRMEPSLVFEIWTPTYDDGDWSVGIQGGWLLGDTKEPFAIAKTPSEAALTAVNWITNFNVSCAVDNALEADYYTREPLEPMW